MLHSWDQKKVLGLSKRQFSLCEVDKTLAGCTSTPQANVEGFSAYLGVVKSRCGGKDTTRSGWRQSVDSKTVNRVTAEEEG